VAYPNIVLKIKIVFITIIFVASLLLLEVFGQALLFAKKIVAQPNKRAAVIEENGYVH